MVRRNRASRRKTRRAGVKAGRTYKNLVGTRAEVWHRTAFKTSYGKTKSEGGDALTRVNLMKNKHGRIVSAKKHATAKKERSLVKHGYTAKKGKFGAVKMHKGKSHSPAKSHKRKTAKRRKTVGGSKKHY